MTPRRGGIRALRARSSRGGFGSRPYSGPAGAHVIRTSQRVSLLRRAQPTFGRSVRDPLDPWQLQEGPGNNDRIHQAQLGAQSLAAVARPVSAATPTIRGMERPVAKVAVDLPLANLDRPFDYLVPEALDAEAVPGARVKVRFAGQLRDGFILERAEPGERAGLSPLAKVVSPEPVLSEPVTALVRAVADHYAGGFADVVRAAVPPRHAATEKASAPQHPEPAISDLSGPLPGYAGADGFLEALAAGGRPRAAWTVLPSPGPAGDWAAGFVEAAAATLAVGRGALLLAPDARHLRLLADAATARFGRGSFAVLAADAGPAARYRPPGRRPFGVGHAGSRVRSGREPRPRRPLGRRQ